MIEYIEVPKSKRFCCSASGENQFLVRLDSLDRGRDLVFSLADRVTADDFDKSSHGRYDVVLRHDADFESLSGFHIAFAAKHNHCTVDIDAESITCVVRPGEFIGHSATGSTIG